MLETSYIGKIGTKLNALRTYNPAVFEPGALGVNLTSSVAVGVSF